MNKTNDLRSKSVFSLFLVLFIAVTSCDTNTVEYNPPLTETYYGYELSVQSVERAGNSWKGGVFEHLAGPGEEIIVIHLSIKHLGGAQKLDIKRIELIGVDNITGESALTGFTIPPTAGDHSKKIAFRMPKGTELKTLKIGGIQFEL